MEKRVAFVMKVKLPEKDSLVWDQIVGNWKLDDPEDYEAAVATDTPDGQWFKECLAVWLANEYVANGGKYATAVELESIEVRGAVQSEGQAVRQE